MQMLFKRRMEENLINALEQPPMIGKLQVDKDGEEDELKDKVGGGSNSGQLADANDDTDKSVIEDSEYNFRSEEDIEEDAPNEYEILMAGTGVQEEVGRNVDDDEEDVASEYTGSDELESYSSTDEDEMKPSNLDTVSSKKT